MTSLTSNKPESFRDIESAWSAFFNAEHWPRLVRNGFDVPPVNVRDEKDQFLIELSAPGKVREDFDVQVDHGVLTISSKEKEEHRSEEKNYTRREFSYASFSRSFSLPENTDKEKVEATYQDGLLCVKIAKKSVEQRKAARRIRVQ